MNEDILASTLEVSFSGTNEDVKNATEFLISCFENPLFPNLLFSIIKNQKYKIPVRKSACIRILHIINNEIIPPDQVSFFCQELSISIESCEAELSPILKKCSNHFILFLYHKSNDPRGLIFELLSTNLIKSSLFYANSFMKIISKSSSNTREFFKLFTSDYILSLRNIIMSFIANNQKKNFEIISLIFQFLSRSTESSRPEIFTDYLQLQFWLPKTMERFNLVQFEKNKYCKFLSHLPQLFKNDRSNEMCSLMNEIISWACENIQKYKAPEIQYFISIVYNLIKFNFFQFDVSFFIGITQNFILQNFNSSNVIEDNHLKINESHKCWKNPHESSINLFEMMIQKDGKFIEIFYSLFQKDEFVQSDLFVSALDLYSFCIGSFYQYDIELFYNFLNHLSEIIKLNDNTKTAICLKIFSKLDDKSIELPPDILLNATFFSLSSIFNEDMLIRYFSALASSSLLSRINGNAELSEQIYEKTPIIQKMDELLGIFFDLERNFQTQMITVSLKRIIFFFGEKIRPFLSQISKEIIDLFFFFSSNNFNREPSVLLCPVVIKLIEIGEGNAEFTKFILSSLLDYGKLSQVVYPNFYDSLFDIFASLIFYSREFIVEFCNIVPFLIGYLVGNDNSHLFADFHKVVEQLIWKKNQIPAENIEMINSIDSVLNSFLIEIIQKCDIFGEWILAASASIKIESFSRLYELNVIIPKLLSFLSASPYIVTNVYVYSIVEHMFSNYANEVFSNNLEIANSLFGAIFLPNAQYPSFIDAFLKSFAFLPNDLKFSAFNESISLVEDKFLNKFDESEDEEDEDYGESDEIKIVWFDEREILNRFIAFCNQFCIHYPQYQERDRILSLLQILRENLFPSVQFSNGGN